MQTITIKTKGRTAEIWKQSLLVGGIVTDENNKVTIISKYYNDKKPLEMYFKSYTERTGLDFFKN